jgi:hypothetical protein
MGACRGVVLRLGRWDKVEQCIIAQVKLLVNITHGITLGRDLGRGLG